MINKQSNKSTTMKKFFSLFAAALMSFSAMAATEFTFSNSVDNQTKDGFTVALAKGGGQSAPAVNTTNDPEVRLYAKNTITITGTGITRVDLTFSKQGQKPYATLSADGGNLASGGESTSNDDQKTDTWTGSANSVTFTLGETGQRVLYSIVINGEGGGDNPGPGPEPTGTITVAEALAIGEKLADNASTTEVYTVVGYVGKAYDFNTQYNNQTWFMTDDKNFDPTARFDFEAYQCTVDKAVVAGDYVALTGNILKYVNNNSGNVTIEIKKGDAKHVIPSVINNVENVVRPIKTIENGHLIIRRADKTYNVMGQNF